MKQVYLSISVPMKDCFPMIGVIGIAESARHYNHYAVIRPNENRNFIHPIAVEALGLKPNHNNQVFCNLAFKHSSSPQLKLGFKVSDKETHEKGYHFVLGHTPLNDLGIVINQDCDKGVLSLEIPAGAPFHEN